MGNATPDVAENADRNSELQPLPRLKHLVVLGRPRTWFFSYFAFLGGVYLAPGSVSPGTTAVGLGLFALWTAATNQINAYTDREEDEINLPGRVSIVDRVGERLLRNVALGSFVGVTAVALWIDPLFGGLTAVAVLDSYFYSMPPLRLKARPLGSLLSFSGAFGFPLAGGYVLATGSVALPPVIWIMTYWFFTYGTVKNLPDYHGDKEAGLRTPATVFDTQRDAILFAGCVLVSPFPVILGAVAAGVVGPHYLAFLVFLPVLVHLIDTSLASDSSDELEIAHTEGFFYALSMGGLFLLLQEQSLTTVGLTIVPFLAVVAVHVTSFDSR